MELKLSNYTAEQILCSYEFVFAQYMSGQLTPKEELEFVPTVYIFGELCAEMRRIYLSLSDAKTKIICDLEKNVVERLTELMNVPQEKLIAIYNDFVKSKTQKPK